MKLKITALILTLLCCYGVHAQLTAAFSVSATEGCSPFKVQFSNQSFGTSGGTTYEWDFGNGNISYLSDPQAIYTEVKAYTVKLTLRDGGKVSTSSQTITVHPVPEFDLVADMDKVCIPSSVQFTVKPKPGQAAFSAFHWDFGDGLTERGYGATNGHAYSFPIEPSVAVTVTNQYGCYQTLRRDGLVKVLPALNVAFNATEEILCRTTDAVQFRNTTTGPGTLSYSWDFGDGTTSAVKEPSHVFNKKGIYTVALQVKSSEGCVITQTKQDYLNVASFQAKFDMPEKVCAWTMMQLQSTSVPATSDLHWTIGDAGDWYNTEPYFQTPETGNLKVRLIAGFGACYDTLVQEKPILPRPEIAEFSSKQLNFCGYPYTVEFTDNTPGSVKSEWSFDWAYNPPMVMETGNKVKRDFFRDDHIVWLRSTNKEGCSAETIQSIYVKSDQVRIVNHTDVPGTFINCDSVAAQFEVFSELTIKKYNWDLGNGATSSEANPIGKYTKPGNYPIKLIYETEEGCKNTLQAADLITVTGRMTPDFDVLQDTVCGANFFLIQNKSKAETDAYGQYHSFWYLNDELTSFYSPESDFWTKVSRPGDYTVKLVLQNPWCSAELTKEKAFYAKGPFPRIISAVNTCEGDRGEVVFTQETLGNATYWEWDFGDGTKQVFTTNEPTVAHHYKESGTYGVSLKVREGDCTIQTYSLNFNVMVKPTNMRLLSSKERICKDDPLSIQLLGMGQVAHFNSYIFVDHYEYEDGSRYLGFFNGSIMYSSEGRDELFNVDPLHKAIRAITVNSLGCYDTSTYLNYTIVGAAADFKVTGDGACFKNAITLTDASVKDGTEIVSWLWDFGDGTQKESATNTPVSHTYENPGNYYVALRIRDQSGCGNFASTAAQSISVYGPKAEFYVGPEYQLNSTISFSNATNTYGANSVEYKWDFGDGTQSTEAYPSKTYTVAGNYTVTLQATDPSTGCRSVVSHSFTVRDFRFAFAKSMSYVQSSCPPVVVQFYNQSVNYTRYVWDFGDGYTLENVPAPSHTYEKPGKYRVKLLVYGHNGLEGMVEDSVSVSLPQPVFSSDKMAYCAGDPVTLQSPTKGISLFTWDFGDGQVAGGTDLKTTHSYSRPGTYNPVLLVTDTNGCTQAVQLNGIAVRKGPELTIGPDDPEVCRGALVQLVASGGLSYEWMPAAGLSRSDIPNPTTIAVNDIRYTVTAKDEIGCATTAYKDIKVVQKEEVSLTASRTEICLGESAQLQAGGTATIRWIGGTDGLNNNAIANPVATPRQTNTYQVVGSDHKGCFSDTAAITIAVRPLPAVDAGPGASIVAGNSFSIPLTASSDVTRYTWSPAQFLDCSNCAQPIARPQTDMTYTVTVFNQYNCTASDTVQLQLICSTTGAAIPNAFSPNGDGKNDRFVIQGVAKINSLIIFDRWGTKVYERKNFFPSDREQCWDGNLRGTPVPAGTYVYFAELECKPGELITRKGSLVLVR